MSQRAATLDVQEQHRLDEGALHRFLAAGLPEYRGDLEVRQFSNGFSNPTYLLITRSRDDQPREYVLRKKPAGRLLASAHQVDREFRILSALRGSGIPVPDARVFCDDGNEVLGQAFYIMDSVDGRVFQDPTLPDVPALERAAIFDSMNEVLARLHALDPRAYGLAEFERPEPYIVRQIERWTKQYRAAQTDDIPEMEQLIEWLPRHLPTEHPVVIAHGDYRLGNLIIHPTQPKVVAVLDWELWTLGHPLCDLAFNCMSYYLDELPAGFAGTDVAALGIPTEAQYVARYCERTGRDGIADWPFYIIFNLFKLASIVQGVYKRALDGTAASPAALSRRRSVLARAKTACSLTW